MKTGGGVEGWGEKAYNCNWITIKVFLKKWKQKGKDSQTIVLIKFRLSWSTCFYSFPQTHNVMDFIWNQGLFSFLCFWAHFYIYLREGIRESETCNSHFPAWGLQGIPHRAPASLLLHHTPHTLTTLVTIFTEGLAAKGSLLCSGAKIWVPGKKTITPENAPSILDTQFS